jgi:hypothetical protein
MSADALQEAFLRGPAPPSAETVAEALSCKLGKALLRRFEDKSEACREAAVSTFKAMLQVGCITMHGSSCHYGIPAAEHHSCTISWPAAAATALAGLHLRRFLKQLFCALLVCFLQDP